MTAFQPHYIFMKNGRTRLRVEGAKSGALFPLSLTKTCVEKYLRPLAQTIRTNTSINTLKSDAQVVILKKNLKCSGH